MTACPHVIAHDATLAEARALMGEYGIRHLPVVRDGQPVGMLSDRDVAQVQALSPDDADHARVVEAMTPVPYAVPPEMALRRVVEMMARHGYGSTIVTDDTDRRVLGVFTSTDALTALATLLDMA